MTNPNLLSVRVSFSAGMIPNSEDRKAIVRRELANQLAMQIIDRMLITYDPSDQSETAHIIAYTPGQDDL